MVSFAGDWFLWWVLPQLEHLGVGTQLAGHFSPRNSVMGSLLVCCSLTASPCRIIFFALSNAKFSSVCSLSDKATSRIPTTNQSLINSFLIAPYSQSSKSWYKLEI